MEARARRIRHHHLRGHALGDERRQHEAHLAAQERAVGDPVGGRVRAPRRPPRPGPARPRRPSAHRRASSRLIAPVPEYRSSTVSVPVRPVGLDHEVEEPLRLPGVRLEEGVGRDLEGETAHALADVVAPAQQVLLHPDRHARLLGVHVHDHARGPRVAGLQSLDQRGQLGHRGRRGHHVGHQLAGLPALAQHQEAQQPLAGVLLVDGEPALGEEGARLAEEARSSGPTGAGSARCRAPSRSARSRAGRRPFHAAGGPPPAGSLPAGRRARATVNSILFR